ncbi:MAG: hypothetical protein ACRDQZ_25555 [Mycobacteriales bacterium]
MKHLGMSNETLEALKSIRARGGTAYKDFTTGLGYQWYDLQPLVDRTFPQITPLISDTPRLPGDGGDSTHWKEIYAINANNLSPGVSERNRNATVVTDLRNHFAPYAELGFEDFVTWKSELEAGRLTPEVKAVAVEDLFYASRQSEEKVLLWGNTGITNGGNGLPLGTAPTPHATLVAGGAMTAQSTGVWVVALTPEGFFNSSVIGGVPALITRNNVGGTTDTYGGGSSKASLESNNVTTAGGNLSVSAHCAVVKGAVGYAWYVGPAGVAATALLAAITTINSVLIVADPAGTDSAANHTVDNSGNGLIYDGMFTQALAGNGLFGSQATGTDGTGTPLTYDGAGGITEIENDFETFWDQSRLIPDEIIVSGQELKNITNKIFAGGGAPLYRINLDGNAGRDNVRAGNLIRQYLGKFAMGGGHEVTITLHPNMPAGTILYRTKALPYRVQNMRYTFNVRTLQEWRQIDWPITQRSWDYGVYVTETAEMHASFAFGVRSNIANA